MRHESIWQASAEARPYAPLSADARVDVAIIGGGLTGLTTAYALARAGKRVAVLEQGRLGSGTTGHTTAMITQIFDTSLSQLCRDYDDETARGVWQAGRLAIGFIEDVVRREALDCDWRRVPAYYFAADADAAERVDAEAHLARRLGFVADFTRERALPPMRHGAMRVAHQGQFHPLRYLFGLAECLTRMGVQIYEKSHVERVHFGDPCLLEANGCVVSARDVVVATRMVVTDALFATRVQAYESYVLGWRVPRGALPSILAWDTDTPYHYWRLVAQADADVLLVGGADHRTGQVSDTGAHYRMLRAYAQSVLKGIPH
ncbi:MAG TPA: FAD-binding oxidoreductase, partial [Oscillatoriaceae cyanobacterium]